MQFEQRTLKFYWPKFRPMLQGWLPTKGNVLFTLLVVGSLLWAQNGGISNLFAAPNAQTVSTGTIPYQGRLANAAGDPLTETVNMSFRLYNAATGGAPLWTEQWTGSNGVQVSDGLFNVMLGSLTSIDQAVITGNSNLFLGITVGTDDEMTPRVQMGSVPYAVQALTVPDGSITQNKASFAPKIFNKPYGGNSVLSQLESPIIYTTWFHGGAGGTASYDLSDIFTQIDAVFVTRTRTSGGTDKLAIFTVTDDSGLNRPTPSQIKIRSYDPVLDQPNSWVQGFVTVIGR